MCRARCAVDAPPARCGTTRRSLRPCNPGQQAYVGLVVKSAPINPAVLDWALNDIGMTDAELAETAKLGPARLRSIRSGAVEPNTTEFRKIAKALGRSPSFLFLPSPPARAPIVAAFRAPAGRSGARRVRPDEQEALRLAARWQLVVGWVRGSLNEPTESPPKIPESASAATVAATLREWLEWDVELQRSATSPSAVLRELRSRIEDRGLLLLQFSLGSQGCRGFSLPGHVPLIAINSSYAPAARVYTVIHELIHVFRGDQSVCTDSRDDDLERLCERAAAAFLIPADDLVPYLDAYVTPGRVETVEDARRVANRYRVSLRAAGVRLIEMKRALQSLYELIESETEGGSNSGFNPNTEPQTTPVRRLRELGDQVPRALIRARDEGVLSEIDVRRYLNVSGPQLEDIEHRLARASSDV